MNIGRIQFKPPLISANLSNDQLWFIYCFGICDGQIMDDCREVFQLSSLKVAWGASNLRSILVEFNHPPLPLFHPIPCSPSIISKSLPLKVRCCGSGCVAIPNVLGRLWCIHDTCFCRKVSSTLHLSVSLFRQGKRRLNANYNSLQSKRHQRFNVSFAVVRLQRRVLTQSWKCSRLWVATVFTRRALAFLLCLRLCWHANHTRTASGDVFKIINSRWCCDSDIFIFLRTHESLHPNHTCWCLSHTIVFCIFAYHVITCCRTALCKLTRV